MHSEIKRWGNSGAVRLSGKILAQAQLSIASPINIEVQEGRIIIERVAQTSQRLRLPFTEADLLEGLNPETSHAQDLATPLVSELGE